MGTKKRKTGSGRRSWKSVAKTLSLRTARLSHISATDSGLVVAVIFVRGDGKPPERVEVIARHIELSGEICACDGLVSVRVTGGGHLKNEIAPKPARRVARASVAPEKVRAGLRRRLLADFMTTPEAAAYTGFAEMTLRKWRSMGDGRGPKFLKIRNAVRYRVEDLQEFLERSPRS